MKKKRVILGRAAFIVAILLGCATGSFAAEKKEQPVKTLDEVVVQADSILQTVATGTKTNTPLEDIPANIVVIPQDIIQAQGGTANLDKVIANVSGISQSSSNNYGYFNNYVLRGLNANFLRDGVSDGPTVNGYSRSLADVERVEVLKGPGSALYGTGSGGGSVNLVSKEPLDNARYAVMGSFGAFNTYETTADLTGPLVPNFLNYRFITDYLNTQGFRNLKRETFEVLPSLLVKSGPNHDTNFDFNYRDINIVSDTNGIPFLGASLTQKNTLLAVPRTNKYFTPFSATHQEILRYAVNDEHRFSDTFLLRNNFVVLHRDMTWLRNSGGSVAAGSRVMTGRILREQTDQVTDYNYQIETVGDADVWNIHHKVLTGFELQYHDISAVRSLAALPNITDVYNPVIPETSKGSLTFVPSFDRLINAGFLGWYAQDQMDLTEQLKLRIGGRIDRFETHVRSALNKVRQFQVNHPFSGQAGLLHHVNKHVSFYGGAASSHQAILTTESTSLGRPESSLQYEIGSRWNFFDQKLNFDVSWYHVSRKDFLVTIGTETIPIGSQATEGVEVDANLKLAPGWNLLANYSRQDATLISVPVSSGPSVNGNRPAGVPYNTANCWTTYELQRGALKGFGVGGGLSYKDSVFLNLQNTSVIPSYVTVDMALFYKKGWFEAQVNMKNLTDTDWYRNGVNSGAFPGDPFGVYGSIRVQFP